MNNNNLILVFNCGSSSIKFAIVAPASGETSITGLVENIFADNTRMLYRFAGEKIETALPSANYAQSMQAIIAMLKNDNDLLTKITGVGHRVVHGGESFTRSTLINDAVASEITACIPLAPLHNPANAVGIKIARDLFPHLPHVAVFDTAFHQSLPAHAYIYAVPYELYEKYNVRRYGFHGTSHLFVTRASAEKLDKPVTECAFISAHLGNGCSVAAVLNGKSVDTSMGFTPLEGLVMGTRSGDVDPSLFSYLHETLKLSHSDIIDLFNKKSGLLGLSGISMDMREITKAADAGNQRARLAIEVTTYRLAKYIASYLIPLGRIDALIFTGGIGENAKNIREKTLRWLKPLGFTLDKKHNDNHGQDNNGIITTANSPIAMVTPTNEEWLIAQDTAALSSQE